MDCEQGAQANYLVAGWIELLGRVRGQRGLFRIAAGIE